VLGFELGSSPLLGSGALPLEPTPPDSLILVKNISYRDDNFRAVPPLLSILYVIFYVLFRKSF
jgi:hypothetical protein